MSQLGRTVIRQGHQDLKTELTARRSNQSILKEINSEYSLGGLMLKLQCFGHLMWRANSLEKTLMLDTRAKSWTQLSDWTTTKPSSPSSSQGNLINESSHFLPYRTKSTKLNKKLVTEDWKIVENVFILLINTSRAKEVTNWPSTV